MIIIVTILGQEVSVLKYYPLSYFLSTTIIETKSILDVELRPKLIKFLA